METKKENKMIAKKFAIGFGIAIVLPMLIHYGVRTFSPAPKWEDYNLKHPIHYQTDSKEEIAKQEAEQDRLEKDRKLHEKRFEKHLFIVAAPAGLIAIIIGAFIAIQAIGTGLIFGGIFTLTDGYYCYWSELPDIWRFLSLLVAFIVLVVVGYKKFKFTEEGTGK